MVNIDNSIFKYIHELNESTIPKKQFFFDNLYKYKDMYSFEYIVIFNLIDTITAVCNRFNITYSTCHRYRKKIDNKIKKNYIELNKLYQNSLDNS